MILVSIPIIQSDDEDRCNKENKRMEIIRRMTVNYAGSDREVNCIAMVNVTECDGVCVSQVAPSARRASGIEKNCRCCKEITMRTREITLEACYDGAELLEGVRPITRIKEPVACSCHTCRN